MKLNRTVTMFALAAFTLLYAASIASAQIHVRKVSDNGADGNAQNWLLQGRNKDLVLSLGTKKATMRREIVCPQMDVENAVASPTPALNGSCESGQYMWVVQFQSTTAQLGLFIGRLVGFNPSDTTSFGVLICDSPGNTTELCTNDPTGTHIPAITTTTTSNSVTFTLPRAFPSYPAGTAQQGRGLTVYVLTQQGTAQQPAPLPLAVPLVGIR
jgi:hypothetical protein